MQMMHHARKVSEVEGNENSQVSQDQHRYDYTAEEQQGSALRHDEACLDLLPMPTGLLPVLWGLSGQGALRRPKEWMIQKQIHGLPASREAYPGGSSSSPSYKYSMCSCRRSFRGGLVSVTRVPSRSLYSLAIFCSSACCSVLVWVTRPSSIILHQGSALGRGVDLTLFSALYISPTSHPGFPSLHNVSTWNGQWWTVCIRLTSR